jgi:hypothetical protein
LAIAAGVALAATATVLRVLVPDDYEHRYAPLSAGGGLHQVVDAGPFEAKADRAQLTRTLTGAGKGVRADGVFVVVTVSARTDAKALVLDDATLHTTRGDYAETDKWVFGTMSTWDIQPEIWRQGQFIFDAPASALPGATLELSDRAPKDPESGPWEWPRVGYELTAQADIGLGITVRSAASPVASVAPILGEPV